IANGTFRASWRAGGSTGLSLLSFGSVASLLSFLSGFSVFFGLPLSSLFFFESSRLLACRSSGLSEGLSFWPPERSTTRTRASSAAPAPPAMIAHFFHGAAAGSLSRRRRGLGDGS